MPAQYTAIRDELETEKGMDENEAQAHAAAIYNAMPSHKGAPVTGKAEPPAHAVHQHLRKHMRRHALLKQMGTKS
ncbi:MAG TPA: hypothetical protein VHP62_01970 [Usitatibacter sp.]|jgi:hypothetical protein|nr:hypothetical protein [Usitatibacter sp.]